jgi:hypothetical protein
MDLLAANFGATLFNNPSHFLTKPTGVGILVSLFLKNSLVIAGILLIFFIVFAGIQLVGAGGNPQKVQAATKLLTYGVAGFLLVFASYFIIGIIETMTGTTIL